LEGEQLGTKWYTAIPKFYITKFYMSLQESAQFFIADVLGLEAVKCTNLEAVLSTESPVNQIVYLFDFYVTQACWDKIKNDQFSVKFPKGSKHIQSQYIEKQYAWVSENVINDMLHKRMLYQKKFLMEINIFVPWLPDRLPDDIVLSETCLKTVQSGQFQFLRMENGNIMLGEDFVEARIVYIDERGDHFILTSALGDLPSTSIRPYENAQQAVARMLACLEIQVPFMVEPETKVERTISAPMKPANIRVQTCIHRVTLYTEERFKERQFPYRLIFNEMNEQEENESSSDVFQGGFGKRFTQNASETASIRKTVALKLKGLVKKN